MLIFVSPSLLKFMHLQGAENYTPRQIFTYMGKIISHITGLGNIIVESQKMNEFNGNLYYDLDNPSSSRL